MFQGGRKGRSKNSKNKKELLAAGVTFPSLMTSLPAFLENGSHFMENTPKQPEFAFEFSNFLPTDANPLKFNDVTSSENDLIIPTFVDTLKPVLSSS